MINQKNDQRLINTKVIPIVISTPFAVGDVHSYLIKDEKNVLIDCGHKSDSSYRQLSSVLNEHGLSIEDIDEIWLTHGHPDHFGQAALLAKEANAVVKGHPKERANFAARDRGDLFETFFIEHNIPDEQIKLMLEQLDWLLQFQEPIVPEVIEEGERLSSGTLNFKVKHTPGHAPGHVVFYTDEGLVFGGDVLLEHISTNALINFDPDSGARNKSLLQYRESLAWMKSREGIVLPGHGKQIANIEQIAENHLRQQQNRYDQIKSLLHQKPYTLYELSENIFADALQRGEHFLVLSEIIGYLDWGEQEGYIEKEKMQDEIIFKANSND